MPVTGVQSNYGAAYAPMDQNKGRVSYFGQGAYGNQNGNNSGLGFIPVTPQIPETEMTQYLRNSMLLGNTTNKAFGLTDNAVDWAGKNGHMGRREMRRFNDTMGLNMDKATRRAFRRALNNKRLKPGQQSIINQYYAGLDNTPTPALLQQMDLANSARNEAFKKAWEEYSTTKLGHQASEGFMDKMNNIKDITQLQQYLSDNADLNGWSKNLNMSGLYKKGTTEADGIYGTGTNNVAKAYYNSLKAGDLLAFKSMLDRISKDTNSRWGRGITSSSLVSGFVDPGEYTATEDDFNRWYQKEGNKVWNADYSNPAKREMASQYLAAGVKFKNGGLFRMNKLNYFQEGGAVAPQAAPAQGEQDMQAQVVQLVQAAMGGDELATQTIQQIMQAAQQGDQQAAQIAQMILEIALQMQGQAQAAKRGAKLSYLRSLKSGCPEGTEAKYYKKGGHICKECVRKACGGTKTMKAQNGIDIEACGGKTKKKYLTGGPAGKPVNKPNVPSKRLDPNNTPKLPGGKYPTYWSPQERGAWERKYGEGDEGAAATNPLPKQQLQKKQAKKNANGGLLTLENLLNAYKFANGGNIPKFLGGGYSALGSYMQSQTTGTNRSKTTSPLRKTTKGRFQVKDKNGRVIATYDTKEKALDHSYSLYGGRNTKAFNAVSEAPALQKTQQSSGKLTNKQVAEGSKRATERRNNRALVLRADRTMEGNHKATKAGQNFSKNATFKEAYNAALGRGDMYFDYKGKVYTLDADDISGIKKNGRTVRDNRAAFEARYGKYLGWGNSPDMGKKSVQHTTLMKDEALGNNPVLIPAEKASKGTTGWNWMNGYNNPYATVNSVGHTLYPWDANGGLAYNDVANDFVKAAAGTIAVGNGAPMLIEAVTPYAYQLSGNLADKAVSWGARQVATGNGGPITSRLMQVGHGNGITDVAPAVTRGAVTNGKNLITPVVESAQGFGSDMAAAGNLLALGASNLWVNAANGIKNGVAVAAPYVTQSAPYAVPGTAIVASTAYGASH